jgi:hypothetical protein
MTVLRLRRKSYVAVESGLDDSPDNYRRGTLGLGFLKGVGDLDAIQANQLINSVPPEFRDRYTIVLEGEQWEEARAMKFPRGPKSEGPALPQGGVGTTSPDRPLLAYSPDDYKY